MIPLAKIDQHIIDFVRKLRKRHNLTQQDIATIIGTTQQFVANVEKSTHPTKYNNIHVNLIAAHFGISPKDFFPEKAIV